MLGWRCSVPAEDPLLGLLLDGAETVSPEDPADSVKAGLIEETGEVWPDAGMFIPLSFTDCNLGAIVEMTQRARERRERELAAVPPVHDFGSHSCWSGDE